MTYYDTHCHIEQLAPEILARCQSSSIKLVSVSMDIKSFNRASRLIERGTKIHKQFIGYHPENVNPDTTGYVTKILDYLSRNRVDGIGEIGLDFNKNLKDHADLQIEAFKEFLSIAEKKNVPVSVHSRQAHYKVLDILKQYNVRVALHWFSGNSKQYQQAIERGYYIGFTPSILNSKSYKNLIKMTPTNLILTESDGPVYNRTPLMIPKVVEKLAEIKGCSKKEMEEIISNNCLSFFEKVNSIRT